MEGRLLSSKIRKAQAGGSTRVVPPTLYVLKGPHKATWCLCCWQPPAEGGHATWRSPRTALGEGSASPSSVIAILNPERARLLLEDAAPHHLGQLLGVAPGVGLHTGPGAGESVESPLSTTTHLQHLRVPLARLPQQAPGKTQRRTSPSHGEMGLQKHQQELAHMCTKLIFFGPFFPHSSQPQTQPPPLPLNKVFSVRTARSCLT